MRRIAAASLLLLACAVSGFPQPRLRILFMPGVADAFYFSMEKGIKARAAKVGAELVVADYPRAWGPEYQVPLLVEAASRGRFDLLLIAPTSTEELKAPLRAIRDGGTEIITVDTFIGDGDYDRKSDYSFPLSYVGSDNELGGRLMAEQLAKLVGEKGRVFCQSTNPDASSIRDRVRGFRAGVAEFPNMQLAGPDWCLDVEEKAREQTLAALRSNRDLVGIFGVNVFSAQGSAQAVVEAGLTGAVKICSWDATPELIRMLRDGQVDLVLAQKPGEMGSLAVDWGVRYLRDRKNVKVPKKIIPGFVFFTRENVDDPAMAQFIYE